MLNFMAIMFKVVLYLLCLRYPDIAQIVEAARSIDPPPLSNRCFIL